MKAYAIDDSGVFIGKVDRQLDPVESKNKKKDVYLMPAGAIDVRPPNIPAGKQARWSGFDWIIEDKPTPPEKPKDPVETPEERDVREKVEAALARLKAADVNSAKTIADLRAIVSDMAIILGVK